MNLISRRTFKNAIGKSSNLNAMLQTNTKAYESVELTDDSKYVHKWRLFWFCMWYTYHVKLSCEHNRKILRIVTNMWNVNIVHNIE